MPSVGSSRRLHFSRNAQVLERIPSALRFSRTAQSAGRDLKVLGVALFYSCLALPGPCRVLDNRVVLLARLLNLHAEPKEVPESPWTENGLQVSSPGRREDAPSNSGLRNKRTRETPGSEKVTHLPLRSTEPKKGIDSIPPCARRIRDSRLWNLARAGLESPGSKKGIDSILTLSVQDPKQDSRLQVSWTPAQNPETQQLADSITFAYDLRIG
ncbi:hypothetical protein R1flu_000024 [Riccia fluitans]|uniref:Uncharacterized protein n=1 Tax=Riccia fluitans TaxID=41844 RepID=A0ABD1Y3F2_9MARC